MVPGFALREHINASSKYWDQIWKIHPTDMLLYKQNAVLGQVGHIFSISVD